MANLGRAITQLTSTAMCYVPGWGRGNPDATEPCSSGMGGDPYIQKVEQKLWSTTSGIPRVVR